MADKNLYINDLEHREATWTFTEATVGGKTRVQFKNGATVMHEGFKLDVVDAYRSIRSDYLNDSNPEFLSTTSQKAALTNMDRGERVFDTDLGRLDCYNSSTWASGGGSGIMKPVAFGTMSEHSVSGSNTNAATKLWTSATVGSLDANGIVTFASSKLKVGTGGGGNWEVGFKATFTNAGGNLTKATVYKNGSAIGNLEDEHPGDSSDARQLTDHNFPVLAVNDELSLHVVSSTPSDLVKIFHAYLYMRRIT